MECDLRSHKIGHVVHLFREWWENALLVRRRGMFFTARSLIWCVPCDFWNNMTAVIIKTSSKTTLLVYHVIINGHTKRKYEPRHDKTNKMSVRPAKTQISLGIRPVWSESSLSAWRKLGSLATHKAQSEDWSHCADAQADLSLRWAHSHFVGFVMSRLICPRSVVLNLF